MGNVITGTGSYLPPKIVTNEDLLAYVDLTQFDTARSGPYPAWVARAMGFEQRRWAEDDQATSDLAWEASRRALQDAALEPRDLDLIILSTGTPDKKVPNTASILQGKLNSGGRSLALDLSAACSGFVYALHVADAMMAHYKEYRNVLVVAAEKASSWVDKRDYITCATFGDGAGAVVLQPGPAGYGIRGSHARSDGEAAGLVDIPAGGTALPITRENFQHIFGQGLHCLRLDTRGVKALAVDKLPESARRVMGQLRLTPKDIAYFLLHQGGRKILECVREDLGIGSEKLLSNLQRYANTSQASIPILLDENRARFQDGDLLLMAAMGGGMGWGSVLYKWRQPAPPATVSPTAQLG